jgi:hypothetical protein
MILEDNDSISHREAMVLIEEKTNQANELIIEAQKIADKFGLEFSFTVAYGMGGYYCGKGSEDWEETSYSSDYGKTGYWMPSSKNC